MPFEPPCVVVWVHIYQTVSGIPCVLRINGRSSCKGEIEARSLESYHSLGRMERASRTEPENPWRMLSTQFHPRMVVAPSQAIDTAAKGHDAVLYHHETCYRSSLAQKQQLESRRITSLNFS